MRLLTLESGERLVLKIPFVQRKLRRELYALEHLRESMPVPQVVDAWQPENDEPGAMLLGIIPGEVVSGEAIPDIAHCWELLCAIVLEPRLLEHTWRLATIYPPTCRNRTVPATPISTTAPETYLPRIGA